MPKTKIQYYGVHKGRKTGVFPTWGECFAQVNGFNKPVYKKFNTHNEADYFAENGIEKELVKMTKFVEFCPGTEPVGEKIHVYTDGSCYGNGAKESYGGIGIFFGQNDPRNVGAPYMDKPTNNRAELAAIVKTLKILSKEIKARRPIIIHTDSVYAIRCFTTYGDKCALKNWEAKDDKGIPNVEIFKDAYHYLKKNPTVRFEYVKAHTNKKDYESMANDMADKLANMGSIMSMEKTNDLGKTKISFGKHKGETIEEVQESDPNYLQWLIKAEISGKNAMTQKMVQRYLS